MDSHSSVSPSSRCKILLPSMVCVLTLILLTLPLTALATLTIIIQPLDSKPINLNGAAVYLIPVQKNAHTISTPSSVEMIQKDLQFSPYIRAIETGTTVYFPNKDAVAHHVYSFSEPQPFELQLYKGKQAPQITFNRPGLLAIGCNIHDWMLGYILVVETPFIEQITELKAQFKHIPAGDYFLRLWHPGLSRKEYINKPVTIATSSQTITVQLQHHLQSQPQPIAPNDPFDESGDFYE